MKLLSIVIYFISSIFLVLIDLLAVCELGNHEARPAQWEMGGNIV